ncbi:MAG TPA: YIP1 family protein [Vicinamibacterales bacterium]|nr:YIP1 family protein [Vicinamibacterales bacterium]
MTATASPTGASSARLSLIDRFIGIITSPRETFGSVAAHPAWLGMFLLTATIVAAGAALPMTTEAGKQAAVDQQVSAMESFGFTVSDADYERIQRSTDFLPYQTAIGAFVMAPVIALVMAGIFFAIFNAGLGGDARFKQVFAVVVHAGVISALAQAFTGPINYLRGSVSSATNLTAVLPMLDDTSFVGRFAGAIDLFIIWWVLALSIGLAVLYRRRTQPIATTLFGIYAVIALAIAAIMGK